MELDHWQRFLEGDDSSFSELYSKYFNELLSYGFKIGFDTEQCKDAIQDLFFKIYASKDKLGHIRNIEFYLLHSLKNRLFDMYHKEIRINRINYEEIILKDSDDIIERLIDNEDQGLIKSKIAQSLKTLRPKQRKIIYYHYHLNISHEEIGILLEMTPDAVKKSIYRSLKKMRENTPPLLIILLVPF